MTHVEWGYPSPAVWNLIRADYKRMAAARGEAESADTLQCYKCRYRYPRETMTARPMPCASKPHRRVYYCRGCRP